MDELIITKDKFDEYNIDDIKNYLYELSNRDSWLDKRVAFAFHKKPFLKQYGSEEDVKQNYYLRLFKTSTMKSLMSRDLLSRMKYINKVISGCISDTIKKSLSSSLVPLTDECMVSTHEDSNDEIYKHLQEVFVDESIEINALHLLANGCSHKDVMEHLDLTRRKYDTIKQTLKEKIEEIRKED